MIEIRDLGKDFEQVHAISHLNLEIAPGIAALPSLVLDIY